MSVMDRNLGLQYKSLMTPENNLRAEKARFPSLDPTLAMLEPLTNSQVFQYHKIEPKDTVSTPKCIVQLTPSQPPSQPIPKESSVVIQSSSVDSSIKKRKRDASPSSKSDKRARPSVGPLVELKRTAVSQNDRPSPTPRSIPTTSSSSSRSINRWRSIARPCAVTSRTDTTEFVSSYDIVKENLNNFKFCELLFHLWLTAFVAPLGLTCLSQDFLNKRDPFDQSFTPEYMPYVDLEYPMTDSSERCVLTVDLLCHVLRTWRRFALLSPKDDDAWHPIKELMDVVYVIVKCMTSIFPMCNHTERLSRLPSRGTREHTRRFEICRSMAYQLFKAETTYTVNYSREAAESSRNVTPRQTGVTIRG